MTRLARARFRVTIAALAALSVGALTACAAPANTEPVANGTLNWAIEGANLGDGHMDPHASQLDVSAYVNRQTLDSLVYLTDEGKIVPWLAKSWQVSSDGKTYTFTLRDDVTFTDGTPFNAEAVKANFTHIMAEETESAQASSMLGGDLYVSTDVVDEFTVKVGFSEPFAPFLANASTAFLGMYSPAVLAESADKLKTGGPKVSVGSGPFILKKIMKNDRLTYTRNPDYAWAPEGFVVGDKAIKTLHIDIVPKVSVRFSALESGEFDLATNLTPNVLDNVGDTLTINSVESPGLPYSLFLNQRSTVFADPKVREAFSLGIDVASAVESVFFGQYDQAFSILSPNTPNSYDASLADRETYDAKKANQLLDEAGWTKRNADGIRTKDGKPLVIKWYSWSPIAEEHKNLASLFADNLAEIGIKLEHKVLEPGEYDEVYRAGEFDVTDWNFASADADILRPHLHSEGYQNASGVKSPELDVMLEEAAASTDAAQREKLYTEVQQWNAANFAIIPVYNDAFITAQAPTVRKVKYDLFGWPILIEAETSHTD